MSRRNRGDEPWRRGPDLVGTGHDEYLCLRQHQHPYVRRSRLARRMNSRREKGPRPPVGSGCGGACLNTQRTMRRNEALRSLKHWVRIQAHTLLMMAIRSKSFGTPASQASARTIGGLPANDPVPKAANRNSPAKATDAVTRRGRHFQAAVARRSRKAIDQKIAGIVRNTSTPRASRRSFGGSCDGIGLCFHTRRRPTCLRRRSPTVTPHTRM